MRNIAVMYPTHHATKDDVEYFILRYVDLLHLQEWEWYGGIYVNKENIGDKLDDLLDHIHAVYTTTGIYFEWLGGDYTVPTHKRIGIIREGNMEWTHTRRAWLERAVSAIPGYKLTMYKLET